MSEKKYIEMTNEEAIQLIKEIHDVDLLNIESGAINPYLQALEYAIQALEKQIPKKPIIYNQLRRNRRGEQFLLDDYEADKCPNCGQRLDLGKESEK